MGNFAELVESGERRDSRGRKLAGDARRAAILEAFDQSGLTQRVFAARDGVNYHTLITWLGRRRLAETQVVRESGAVRFAEVRMPRLGPGLEVSLPNGMVVRGPDGEQIAALVKILTR